MKFAAAVLCVMVGTTTLLSPSSAQDAAAGERLFRSRCAACHSVQSGQNRVGPHLAGIVGRQAGAVEGARYSPALRNLGTSWDSEALDRFLANPRAAVQGTTMNVGVPNAGDRADIVAYLRTLQALQN